MSVARSSLRVSVGTALFVLSTLWALLIPTVPLLSKHEATSSRAVVAMTYLFGSVVCHQRAERSFHVDGVQFPVCARCTGLYLAAPLGFGLAFRSSRRRPALMRIGTARARIALLFAALPTAVTALAEWLGTAHASGLVRAVAAVPLGLTVAWIVAATIRGDLR